MTASFKRNKSCAETYPPQILAVEFAALPAGVSAREATSTGNDGNEDEQSRKNIPQMGLPNVFTGEGNSLVRSRID